MDVFHRAGLVKSMGKDHFFRTRTSAIDKAFIEVGDDQADSSPLRKSIQRDEEQKEET